MNALGVVLLILATLVVVSVYATSDSVLGVRWHHVAAGLWVGLNFYLILN